MKILIQCALPSLEERASQLDHILKSNLRTVNNLGLLYSTKGKLDEAEQIYDRALTGKEKALGPEHSSTLDTVNNLGNLYTYRGKLDEAEQMHERALVGYTKALAILMCRPRPVQCSSRRYLPCQLPSAGGASFMLSALKHYRSVLNTCPPCRIQ